MTREEDKVSAATGPRREWTRWTCFGASVSHMQAVKAVMGGREGWRGGTDHDHSNIKYITNERLQLFAAMHPAPGQQLAFRRNTSVQYSVVWIGAHCTTLLFSAFCHSEIAIQLLSE